MKTRRLILYSDFRVIQSEINRQLKPFGLRVKFRSRRDWADQITIEVIELKPWAASATPELLEACRQASAYARLNTASKPPESTSLAIARVCEAAITKATGCKL